MKNAKLIIGIAVGVVAIVAIVLAIALSGGSHTHEFGEWDVTEKPTCSEKGTKVRYCACGEKQTEMIATLDHNYVDGECTNCGDIKEIPECKHGNVEVLAAKAPTCTEQGLTEGKQCSVCGTITVAQQTIPTVAHTYDNKYDESCNECGFIRAAECAHIETEILKGYAATCTSTGLTDGEKCKKCGEILTSQVAINTVPHVEVIDQAVAATCTSTGLTDGKHCSACGTITVAQQTIPTVAHTYDNKYDESCNECGFIRAAECAHIETEILKGYAATCTSTGLTDGEKCKKCGEILTSQVAINTVPHVEVIDQAVAATCTSTGLTEGKHCSACGTITVAQQTTPTVAHTYDNKYDESCNECGFIRAAECAHIETEILKGYAATCTSTGLTDGEKCKKCGEILTSQVAINTVPHVEVIDQAVAATCTSTGLTEGKHCSACTAILIAQTVTPIKEHKVVIDSAVNPTCTTAGLTEGRHCSVCNTITIAQNKIDALGHNESDWIIEKESTDIEEGYRYKICSRCGKKTAEEDIPCLPPIGLDCEINAENKTCTVTGIGSFSDTELVIPKYIMGYKVIGIGAKAFENCANLTKITLPETVKTIGTRAFYGCTGITEITIPESVSSIGTQIFYKASNLATVYYNGTYGSETNQFLNLSHITKIVFGGSKVPDYICYNNTTLQTIEILDSVTSIGWYAFYHCTGLTSIVIPDSVTSIGWYVFDGCTGLTSIVIPDSVETIGEYAFAYCSNLSEITIGESLRAIGNYAFSRCTGLTSIVIPDSVTSIGSSAFYDCTGLTSIVIPDSVTSIGSSAFCGCTGLTSIVIPDSVTSISGSAFSRCTGLTSIVIPDSVTSIGSQAFYGCTDLTSIVIPDSVTSISEGAFRNCTGLTSIVIPDSVTSIGYETFRSCTGLTSIVIGDSVTSIGVRAFYYCTRLMSIEIGDGVTSIGDYAFSGCCKLVEVINKSALNIVAGSANNEYVAYYAIEVHNGESKIVNKNDYLFYTYGGVNYLLGYAGDDTELTLPGSYDGKSYEIYDYAFYDCDGLTSIVIPDSVTSIGYAAFYGCTGLTSIVIGDSVTSIGELAFYNCTGLTNVYYTGTEAEWAKISIDYYGNSYLTNATKHYNYVPTN